jgi:Rrf2 family protein
MPRGLRISQAASMGAHALALLAERRGERMTTAQIASQLDVSPHHLAKVLLRLSKAGFVNSTRGRHGGFALTRRGRSATLLEVIELIDGRLAPEENPVGVCPPADAPGGARHGFTSVKGKLIEGLGQITVGEARSAMAAGLPAIAADRGLGRPAADWRAILDSVNDAVLVLDMDTGEIAHVNRRFCEGRGVSAEEARELGIAAMASDEAPFTRENALEWVRKAVREGPQAVEWQAKNARGESRMFDVSMQRMTLGDRDFVIAIGKDITERKEAERAARLSKELLQKTFLSLRDAVFILDVERPAVIVECNPAAEEMFGYSRSEMLGRPTAFLHVDEAAFEEFRRHLHAAIEEHGFMDTYPSSMKRKDGTVFPTEHTSARLLDDDGEVMGWVSVVRDITERKQATEALRLSNRLLEITTRHSVVSPLLEEFVTEVKSFTGCAAVGIRLLDDEGNIPYEAYEGFSREFFELESPLSIKSDKCMCITVVKGTADPALPFITQGGSFYMNGTTRFLATVSEEEKGETRNACNEYGYESVALVPIRLGDRCLGLIHVADPQENRVPLQIVTALESAALELGEAIQRVRAEEALRESEERLRATISSMDDLVFVFDEHGTFVEYHQPLSRTDLYAPPEEFVGKSFTEVLPPAVGSQLQTAIGQAVSTGRVQQFDYSLEMPGEVRWFSAKLSVRRGASAEFTGITAVVRDITESKRAQDALRDAAQEWQVTFDAVGTAVCLLDAEGTIAHANKAMEELVGRSLGEIAGQDWCELVHGGSERPEGCPVVRAMESLKRESSDLLLPDGRWLRATADPLVDDAGRFAGAVHALSDITERKQAEQRLGRCAAMLEAMPHGVTATDMQGVLIDANAAIVDQLGHGIEELIGKMPCDFLASKEDRARFHEQRDILASGGTPGPTLYNAVHKDGSIVPIVVTFAIIRDKEGLPSAVVAISRKVVGVAQAQQPAA